MPTKRTYAEVRSDKNIADTWYNKAATEDSIKKFAFHRVSKQVFEVVHSPKFVFDKSMSFFLMGSCFARGLENILTNRGFDVRSVSDAFNRWEPQYEKGRPIGTTNRYNTASIRNEFEWHVAGDGGMAESTLLELGDDIYFDPHATQTIAPTTLADQNERRALWSQICSEILNVDVVVITLGLVEVWFDTETGLYLNATPDPRFAMRNKGRFEVHILDYNDNLANMNRIYEIMSEKNPDAKLIVTVSPVPLLKTFSGEDIVVANSYSKNTLRAVAGDFCRGKPNVDYFPSYEIALHSDRSIVWREDFRHVEGPFSRQIMGQFLQSYLRDQETIEAAEYDIDVLS